MPRRFLFPASIPPDKQLHPIGYNIPTSHKIYTRKGVNSSPCLPLSDGKKQKAALPFTWQGGVSGLFIQEILFSFYHLLQ